MIRKFGFIIFVFFVFNNKLIIGQCSLYELPLKQKVEKSSDIIEGKVLKKSCFWNEQHSLIYTANVVEVIKVFKGTLTALRLEIITEGGVIGKERHSLEPNLTLELGDVGLFMCIPAQVSNPINTESMLPSFQCYGGSQGFFKYNLQSNAASVPFVDYKDIQGDLYASIMDITGINYYEIQKNIHAGGQRLEPFHAKAGGTISSFSPTSISGGTFSVLTINGSGFGATQSTSTVNFKNSNNGGAGYMSPNPVNYISWSDTKIEVEVPAKVGTGTAGTGTIQVVVGGTPITSDSELIVKYTESNTSGDTAYQTTFIDRNSSGGLTWQFNTDFKNNTAANNSFRRALQTWNDGTKINWNVSSTTTAVDEIAYDSINVVRFDNGSELPAGTLARCHYYWVGCGYTVADIWTVFELDMVIDDSTLWEYGPAAPAGSFFDFESVMLHELGHGHQLGHVIESSDVMHYSVTPATTKRTLNANNLEAGNDVINRSVVGGYCGLEPMVPASFVLTAIEKNDADDDVILYPNPSSGIFTIELAEDSQLLKSVFVQNALGQEVFALTQLENANRMKIELKNAPTGVYTINLIAETELIKKKIIIQ